MSNLVKREAAFIKLLLVTSNEQQRAIIKTITPRQLKAAVQVVYNVLKGNLYLPDKHKRKLQRHKQVIRRFISKGITREKRIKLLLKYLKLILLLIHPVVREL